MANLISRRPKHTSEDHWIPLSDVMTGLMMIFMLVAIVFMIQVKKKEAEIEASANVIKALSIDYNDLRGQLYADLAKEFREDLLRWGAELSPKNLSIRFKEPSVQFDVGSCAIKPAFAEILRSFFPRYVRVLFSPKYRASIDEVRIEGHTSRRWDRVMNAEEAYYKNMELSQCRTREVLRFTFGLADVRDFERLSWLVREVTANGLSSSKPIFISGTTDEDEASSQRVEFRVKTNAEERLERILAALPK
jgi:outer membrane protein OmpA-like peptidoglycan-associated protein